MKNFRKLTKSGKSFGRIAFFVLMFSTVSAYSQFNPIQFIRDSLPNGLQIIYQIDRSAPVVATVVHYKVGSRDENPSRTGFAHFFEHLMFEATDNIPRSSIDKYVQDAGGTLNAHTSFDETVYFFKLPSNELKLALWIESQRMRKLQVNEIGVETQRGVVKEERKMRNDNTPYGTWMEKMMEKLFPGSSYSWTPIGSAQHIDKAQIVEFQNFYNNFYQPINAILVIAGDINLDDTKKYVRDYFGPIPTAPMPVREEFNLTKVEKLSNETIEDAKAQLPAVFIGYTAPKLGEPDYYVFNLLTQVLSSGESSRLYQRLVVKDQIAVAAQVAPLNLQYAGACLLIGVAAPGKDIKDVEKNLIDEINKFIKNGLTDEEFLKAKNISETQFISNKKNVLEKAQDLAQYLAYFGDPNLINTEFDRYSKITKEDLVRVAQKYFDTDKRVVLTYVPKTGE